MREHPDYRFSALESYTAEDVAVLNHVVDSLATSDALPRMLRAAGETLLSYDIYSELDVEFSLLVKPVGEAGKPHFFRFNRPPVGLGRIPENHVCLKSPLVSKKHAEIVLRGTEFCLRDLNSNNGTYLNQVKLNPETEVLLKNDDVIKIEPFEIVVGLSADAAKRPLGITLAGARHVRDGNAAGQIQIYFEMHPSQFTGAVLLDRTAAKWMVHKITTGQKEGVEWTEIESGLMEFLSCRMLAVLNPFLQGSRLLFQSVETEPDAFSEWRGKQQRLVCLPMIARGEIGTVCALVYLPDSVMNPVPPRSDVRSFLASAPWIKSRTYFFWIQLGVSLLQPGQISLLEEGDIILMDRADVVLDRGRPRGKVTLRSGQLQRGAIRGSLDYTVSGSLAIAVESLYQEGLKRMTETNKKLDPQGESPDGLVAGLEIPVTVELARLSFTLEEVSSLKEGQIIELEKGQPELVDLSIDGKIIANGKLVDVEGKLGVRLLKVLKGK